MTVYMCPGVQFFILPSYHRFYVRQRSTTQHISADLRGGDIELHLLELRILEGAGHPDVSDETGKP